MVYTLPRLPYAYDAMEPYIDAQTMEIHYTRHHQTYIDNLNKALEHYPDLQKKPLIELLTDLKRLPESIRTTVRNNGGGHYNHTLFWSMMSDKGGGLPKGKVADAIAKQFMAFENFQTQFNTAAKGVFGSGWAWLVVDKNGKLVVTATANQDAPIQDGSLPILGLDVWEHAYYLKYQNKRIDYISSWWHVVNWNQVEENYRMIIE